nr:F-box domain [Pandoravirus massiliensis]
MTQRQCDTTVANDDGMSPPFLKKKRARPEGDEDGADAKDSGLTDAFSVLPDEILAFIFQGRTLDGRFVLDPRWRVLLSMTCRRWRRIIATPARTTVAALERMRPSCAAPQTWAVGRVMCASVLRDAVSLLPRDMGAINAWLRLLPSICGNCDGVDDARLAAAVAIAASGNTTAIRDVRHWGLDDPCKMIPAAWFGEDTNTSAQLHDDDNNNNNGDGDADEDGLEQRPRSLAVAWGVVRAACKNPVARAGIDWATGRWNAALGAQHCDWRALSLDIAATGSPSILNTIMQCLGPSGRRALWNAMIRACLAAPSPADTDLLLARLFEMADGRDEHLVLDTAKRSLERRRNAHDADAHRSERLVAFVPWFAEAKRWCLLAMSADRPRAAATAIHLWGVPKCAFPDRRLDALMTIEADCKVAAIEEEGGSGLGATNGAEDDDMYAVEHGGHEPDDAHVDDDAVVSRVSEQGFWHTAVVYAIAGGAVGSLNWLIGGNDDHGAVEPAGRCAVATPSLALRAVIEALCTPVGDAMRLLVGLRHLKTLATVQPLPTRLIASALSIFARGANLYLASGIVLAALTLCPSAMCADTLACDLAAAASGLLRAREWSMLDALIAAVDDAPPDLFDHRSAFDLWMAVACDCRRASIAHGTASVVEVHNRIRGLYFLAMRAGALPVDALVAGVIDDDTRRGLFAPDTGAWRRWCRVRPLVLDCTAAEIADAVADGGILSPVDPAWSALWSCGLVRGADGSVGC